MKKNLFAIALIGAALFVSCGDSNKTGLRKGSLSSDFDSLSYAIGVNISSGVSQQMANVPFNYSEINKGIEEGALGEPTMTHEEAIKVMRDYFMTKRGPRAEKIAQRNAADSTITPVVADSEMFITEEERDSVSYAFGIDIANNITNSKLPLQVVWLTKAMQDTREGNEELNNETASSYLQYYFMTKLPADNKKASEEFLAEAEKKAGVKKTESGILYEITREGDATVIATDSRDVVVVNYKGTTRTGEEFDSSYERGEVFTTPLNRVIQGWTEGMKLVGKGGAITLWIPAELAYGERAQGPIGANEALRFDVEVIDVKPFVETATEAAAK